jgi:hypothetical protein
MRYEHHGEHEYPIRKDWRYSPGELIRISRSHHIWRDDLESAQFHLYRSPTSPRVEEGDLVVFLQAYGYSYYGTNWKRDAWNLKVLSPTLGIIWVSDEYTEHVENVLLETVEIGL